MLPAAHSQLPEQPRGAQLFTDSPAVPSRPSPNSDSVTRLVRVRILSAIGRESHLSGTGSVEGRRTEAGETRDAARASAAHGEPC